MANLLFVSIETTGLDPVQHGIRSIMVHNAGVTERIDIKLYSDYDHMLIERGVFTADDLDKGTDKLDALRKFTAMSQVTGVKPQLVVWSAKFAVPFLEQLSIKNGDSTAGRFLFHPEVIDVQNLYGFLMRDIRDRLPNFQFNTICKAMGLKPAFTPEDKLNNLISLISEIPDKCILN